MADISPTGRAILERTERVRARRMELEIEQTKTAILAKEIQLEEMAIQIEKGQEEIVGFKNSLKNKIKELAELGTEEKES